MRASQLGFRGGLLAGVVVAVLLLAAVAPLREALLPSDPAADRVASALEVIEDSYFEQVDATELEDASIRGMVRLLRQRHDDRFSHYFDPETYERFRRSAAGELSGIGLEVREIARGLRIARVFEDTPAEQAGLVRGDRIVAVEGESIAGEPAEAAAARIRGEPGTEVEITVLDRETGERTDHLIERATVRIPAVEGRMRKAQGQPIAHVELRSFSRGAHGELRSRIEELHREGAEGLVLDLRGNGGGLLQEAVLVASLFVPEGPIVSTEGRTRGAQTLEAQGDPIEPRPMAVLIDRGTASAAEIVAAAIQENELGTLVGSRTFGKGTFQEVIDLGDGSALDLTVGQYLTSDGSSIAETGVRPDRRVREGDPEERDDVLRAGLRALAAELDGER